LDDFIEQEIGRQVRFTEFAGSLKHTPGNLEGLLYQLGIGHAGENGSAVALFLERRATRQAGWSHVDWESTNSDNEKPDTQCRADRQYTFRIDNADTKSASARAVCAQGNRGTKWLDRHNSGG
jgi:hypothetical protein